MEVGHIEQLAQTDASLYAACDFSFSPEQFCEYSCICDFMSKWKKWLILIALMSFFIVLTFYIFSTLGFPFWYTLFYPILFLILMMPFFISFITQAPPLWFLKKKRVHVMRMHAKEIGLDYPDNKTICRFELSKGVISLTTDKEEIAAPLYEIKWVRRKEDLVVIGCLEDSNSVNLQPIMLKKDFKAVPGIAFLVSELHGMDSASLIDLLEKYACQHRKEYFTKLRFWRLEDDE